MTQPREQSNYDAVSFVLQPALQVGTGSAGIGFLIGGTSGILRNTTPFLFGLASAIQCATLGTTFWATRQWLLLSLAKRVDAAPGELTAISGTAGGFTGGLIGALFRGRRNVIPGAVCISIFAASGQMLTNYWTKERPEVKKGPNLLQTITASSWSPMRSITDQQHAEILREKLLKIEVEIALIDDKIAALKQQQAVGHRDQP